MNGSTNRPPTDRQHTGTGVRSRCRAFSKGLGSFLPAMMNRRYSAIKDLMAGRDVLKVRQHRADTLVNQHPVFAFGKKPCANPGGYIVETMHAVFQSFFTTASFEDCLIDVVNRGGDADTTGALAGMLAGAHYGLDGIPKRWLKAIDEKVSQQCLEQTRELLALAGH